MPEAMPSRPSFKVLRRRYTIVDHEDANSIEVGPAIVLSPAKNPADLAALYTLAENVEPAFAEDLRAMIAWVEQHPQRNLGTYGVACLPHITHPSVKPFADERLKPNGS
jgi:hypothetical protein